MVLQNAEKLNCRVFVQPKDIINGSMKLNLAFLANLFNTNPALDPPAPQPAPVIQETREEKSEFLLFLEVYHPTIKALEPTSRFLYTEKNNDS